MRVAHLSHSAAPSGAELFVLRVAAASMATTPLVVLGEDGPLREMLETAGVPWLVVPVGEALRAHGASHRRGLPAKLRGTATAAQRLADVLRERRIDVAVTHSAKAHVYGGLAARMAGVPSVAHVHDLVGASGRWSDTLTLRAALAMLPRGLVANSETTRRSLGRTGRRATVIGCPAAIGPVDTHQGPLTFGMIGRLSEWKGQEAVIRAFSAAAQRGLPEDATLRIVGGALFDGDRAYERALRQVVADLDLEGRVHFRGHRSEIANELAAVDVVVHASIRPEPFGQVVVEAMAAGRAVIASDAGGPAEILDHSRTGLLVRAGDVAALADAMVKLQDAQVRVPMAAAARRAARKYALPEIVEAVERELRRHA